METDRVLEEDFWIARAWEGVVSWTQWCLFD